SKLLPVRDDEADKCRDWPRGVEVITGSGRTGYRLRVFTPGRQPLQIDAYVSWDALWEDLQGGKLDGVLAAEHDVREAPSWTRITRSRGRGSDAAHAVWLQMPGGQQIVVRLDRAEKLNPQSRRALSLAAPRQALVNLPGPGAFVPTEMFLAPLLNVTPAAPGLETDALEARKLWLGAWGGEENPSGEPVPESGPAPESGIAPESLQLLLPENPYLERLASLLADRWRRSLNLGLEIHPLGMTMFAERAAGAVSSLVLDVVDLDDGSLQDLWEKSLAGYAPGAGAPVTLENLELSLRERMPYVPLLRNVHYLVLPREGGKSRSTEDICPGCLPVPPPSPLDPPRPAPMPRDG
ncbi:MAG: hypothetical protein OEZ59_05220, partial [Deltaproteobacteria bacterium]|nr:hypothetical protein [Deltaproteobacteria bacterium]